MTRVIDTGTDQLLCEVRERVAVITLNRPEARNALGDILTPALRRMIREGGEDDDVGAILITGAGTAFCAGGDVKSMGSGPAKPPRTPAERAADLKELAKRKNVFCKFSGVATEVRDDGWDTDTVRPYWEVALEAFGSRNPRLIPTNVTVTSAWTHSST